MRSEVSTAKELGGNLEKDSFKTRDSDITRIPFNDKMKNTPNSEFSDKLSEILKQKGFSADDSNQSEQKLDSNDFKYLEKIDNGENKIRDKETGKEYDSIASWHKSQETLEKRFNSTAEYYQNKASKEWARFVNADENGYSDSEKWNHFRNSQYCYEKKHEFEQKAAHIRERIDVINESIKKYSDDLSNKSEFSSTIKTPPFELSDIKMRTPEENAKMREEFDDYKADLKREWEKANGTSWPKYKEDVISQSGKVIRKEGSDYDAHHIQPLSMGGKNEVSNITPLHADVHYDKQGIHSNDSPYSQLNKIFGGI